MRRDLTVTASPYRASAPALAAAPLAFVAVFALLPLGNISSRALSWQAFTRIAANRSVREMLWFSAWQALASTLLTLVAAFPVTYILARYRFAGKRALLALITLPFVLPTVVVGAAFLALLPNSWHRSVAAILLAHAYFNIAVVARVVGRRLEQISRTIAEAAATLGAPPMTALRTVTLPLLRTAIASASAVIFLLCFTSYGVIRILGGPARSTIEVAIYSRAVQLSDISGAAVLSLMQLLVLGLAMLWWFRISRATAPLERVEVALRRPQTLRQKTFVYGAATTTAVMVALPLAMVFLRSLGDGRNLSAWRGVLSGQGALGGGRSPLSAFATSLQYALATSLTAGVIGISAAAAIAYGGRAAARLEVLTTLPLAISAVTLGLGLLVTFDSGIYDLRSRWVMIPIAHSLVALPIVVRTMLPVLRSVPVGLREAAATLGATPIYMWRTIDRPLLARAWATSLALAAAVSIGEFGASSFLTRRTTTTLPTEIASLLGRPGDAVQAQAYVLATLLIIFIGAALLSVDSLRRDRLVA